MKIAPNIFGLDNKLNAPAFLRARALAVRNFRTAETKYWWVYADVENFAQYRYSLIIRQAIAEQGAVAPDQRVGPCALEAAQGGCTGDNLVGALGRILGIESITRRFEPQAAVSSSHTSVPERVRRPRCWGRPLTPSFDDAAAPVASEPVRPSVTAQVYKGALVRLSSSRVTFRTGTVYIGLTFVNICHLLSLLML